MRARERETARPGHPISPGPISPISPRRWPVPLAAAASLGMAAGCGAPSTPPVEHVYNVHPVSPRDLHVATASLDCGDARAPCAGDPAPPRRQGPATCWNGSLTDCNPVGTTRSPTSAWVDPEPPDGWAQCAGFLNTEEDDVEPGFLDGCLGASSLRLRVLAPTGKLEEDITLRDIPPVVAWPKWDYLRGDPERAVHTHWGDTTFFVTTDGTDACMKPVTSSGPTFGSGNGNVAIVVGGGEGDDEYRINCGGASLPGRRIALYLHPRTAAVEAPRLHEKPR